MHRTDANNRGRLAALTAAAFAALALAIPAVAAAHPSVYETEALLQPTVTEGENQVPDPACNYELVPDGSCLNAGAIGYAVANHGHTIAYTESNGVTSGGVISFKRLPSGYRNNPAYDMTPEEKIEFAPALTGVQAHATCSGLAAFAAAANVVAWQGEGDFDPFYAYLPFQKVSAGLGDDPADWIPVAAELGVDLAGLAGDDPTTEAENEEAIAAKALCEGKGGTYVPADTASNITSSQETEAAEPLEAEVASLLSEKSTLQAQIDAWSAKGAGLEGEKAALAAENATLAAQAATLSNQVRAVKQANKKKTARIKTLRKQLKQAKANG